MSQIKNPLELYKHLNKSNCRKCLLPSCMAFAVAVIQGQKTLTDCPDMDTETVKELSAGIVSRNSRQTDTESILKEFRKEITQIDLAEAARRLDAPFQDGMIAINCLGKDFKIDATGEMTSECHRNPWVEVPVLHYILRSKGKQPTGEWVTFGSLKGAAEWNQFFTHRCELEMGKLADAHNDLFFEILHIFGAQEIDKVTNSDQSLVIYPLPRLPLLINYWEPEDAFESKLSILFDKTAEENINTESIYLLGRGLVEMFRKLIVQHTRDGKLF
ncbi:MAG: DUF3786 domain-containing protein [Desulfobulbaceae bacterium]|nr:DUF3786 domain-containing protein [Desulfobulbaceae bacterium]